MTDSQICKSHLTSPKFLSPNSSTPFVCKSILSLVFQNYFSGITTQPICRPKTLIPSSNPYPLHQQVQDVHEPNHPELKRLLTSTAVTPGYHHLSQYLKALDFTQMIRSLFSENPPCLKTAVKALHDLHHPPFL